MLDALRMFYETSPLIAWIITACAVVTVISAAYFVISSKRG